MRLDPPPARDRGEPVAPMINVVFLLLIFFMMAATLAPPDPIETAPPVSAIENDESRQATLFLGADGALAMGALRGDAVFGALAPGGALDLKADAGASAQTLAETLARLRAAGAGDVRLIVEAR